MTFQDNLMGLRGKKVAVCHSDAKCFEELQTLLKHYGLTVVGLNSVEAIMADLESRRYSTHRVYIAVFISASFVQEMEALWVNITQMNPSVLQTPLILMSSQAQKKALQPLIDKGYFKFCIESPFSATAVVRILRRLNRWKSMKGDTTPAATLER